MHVLVVWEASGHEVAGCIRPAVAGAVAAAEAGKLWEARRAFLRAVVSGAFSSCLGAPILARRPCSR